jgi:hypothetical protein
MRTFPLVAFLLVIECAASLGWANVPQQQQKPCGGPCGEPTAWQDFNRFTLRVTTPTAAAYSQWKGDIDEATNDIQVVVEQSEGRSVVNGMILMIGGRVMAIQGPIAQPGYEIDALDGFALQLQLVMKLLGRAYPRGPASTKTIQDVDYSDDATGVEIATQSASGTIQAPWRIVGKLKHVESDSIDFDLTLTSRNARESSKEIIVRFSGVLSSSTNSQIDDNLNLDGWKLFDVGPQSRKQGDSTTIDYSAAPEPTKYKTVAEVRKALQAADYAGEPDSSRDFTGFWETSCDDGYGLQITHFGIEGKYAIVFCGPGGCGDPAEEGRKTFITKDPQFQVISEDELREKAGDGWDTYHRCTKNPHPTLRLK